MRATQATAQRAQWCALYRYFCTSQGGHGMHRGVVVVVDVVVVVVMYGRGRGRARVLSSLPEVGVIVVVIGTRGWRGRVVDVIVALSGRVATSSSQGGRG